ncbi:Uncharacterised protein [Parvimonas micra]|uniref:Uncharacterized protein n=1 Tax=Parvimonas micra ATCC 33270 TaxID=411465 RepID=A8SJ32_9FIRM|nr:hypothetical protein PEPMIC_00439 [Parvimonas micra ATCC 33270]RSB91443.1 hypothetical protein EGS00_06965 [Parvimonas micra]VEH95625.1 Uncharacterised protein [Parvimonas micra]
MEYLKIGIIIIVILLTVLLIYILYKNKKNSKLKDLEVATLTTIENDNLVEITKNSESHDKIIFDINIDTVSENIFDDNKLVEINDSKVISHVNSLIPGLIQTGISVRNLVNSTRDVYRVVLPAGAKLANSKTMKGAFRAIYHGADGIKGHANLVKDTTQKGIGIVTNSVSYVMNITSMVVGQYYMSQINNELDKINNNLSEIKNFQDNEYKGRVISLVSHIKNIADFKVEILEDNDLRLLKINKLERMEEECTKLLVQANLTIEGYSKKTDLKYEEYEKIVGESHNWFMYQNLLLYTLSKISDLSYTLNLGKASREQCSDILTKYKNDVSKIQNSLNSWHNEMVQSLNINLESNLIKRVGIDKVIHYPFILVNEKYNYRSIDENTTKMIIGQSPKFEIQSNYDTSELYNEDVQIISKGGKLYYLPLDKEK